MKGKWWKKHSTLANNFKNISSCFAGNTTDYNPVNAYWLGYSAERVYKGGVYLQEQAISNWGFHQFDFIKHSDTQCFVASTDKFTVVVFRGTETDKVKDLITDLDMGLTSGYGGKVHHGFKKAYKGIKDKLAQKLEEHNAKAKPLWLGGHSLGGALATLAAHDLINDGYEVYGLYTIGQPRVGNDDFVQSLNELLPNRYFRYSNVDDKIPGIPDKNLGYRHGGQNIYVLSRNRLSRKKKKSNNLLRALKSLTKIYSAHASSNYCVALRKNIANNPLK